MAQKKKEIKKECETREKSTAKPDSSPKSQNEAPLENKVNSEKHEKAKSSKTSKSESKKDDKGKASKRGETKGSDSENA